MNFSERRRYWRSSARQMRTFELQYAVKIQKLIRKQVDEMVKDAAEVGFQRAWSRMATFNDKFIDLLTDLYKKVSLRFGVQVNRILQAEERKDIFFNAELIQRVVNILGRHALELVTRMDDTTKQELLKIIVQGEQEQLSYREIALRIENSYIVQYARALTIARTEVGRAANVGSMEAAGMQRFQVQKVWIAGKDNLTRRFGRKDEYDHTLMDGQVKEYNEAFEQTGLKGVTAVAQQPGDPDAPPSYTINCRCVVAFRGKRDASGRLIRK